MPRANKNWRTRLGPWVVLLGIIIALLTFLAVEAEADTWWTILELVIYTLLVVVDIWCHLKSWLSDPGYI